MSAVVDKGPLGIRMPDDMRERLKIEAAANSRSMNAEICFRLEQSFGTARAIPPELVRLVDQHIEAEVQVRLKAIAAKLSGGA